MKFYTEGHVPSNIISASLLICVARDGVWKPSANDDKDDVDAADKNPTMIYWNIVSVILPGRRALCRRTAVAVAYNFSDSTSFRDKAIAAAVAVWHVGDLSESTKMYGKTVRIFAYFESMAWAWIFWRGVWSWWRVH